VRARPDTLGYRLGKFVRRNRWGVAAGVALAATLLMGLVGTTWQARRAAAERDRAREEAARTASVTAFLQSVLASANPDWTQGGSREITVREVLGQASLRLDSELSRAPEIRAQILRTLGLSYRGMGLYDEAVANLRDALDLVSSDDPGGETEAETRYYLAQALMLQGELTEAEEHFRAVLSRWRAVGPPDDLFLLGATNDYGLLQLARGRPREASSLFEEAARIGHSTWPSGRHPALAVVGGNLCQAAWRQGDLVTAESRCRAALGSFSGMEAPYPLERSSVLAKLGAVLLARGNSEEAEALIEAAVEVGRSGPGPGHPSLIFPLQQLAELRLAQGRYEEAETAAREALTIQEGSGHLGAAGHAEALATLGGVLLVRGQAEAAEAILAEALALQEAIYPAGSPLTAATRERLERARADHDPLGSLFRENR